MERFELKTAVAFGENALAALEALPGQRVMVVTDGFLAGSGLLDKVLARLEGRQVEVFDQVVPDPPLDLVARGARALADFRPEAVVAFGGGSALDCAKAMAQFGRKLGAPEDLSLCAVPTTAGTGSEVTSFAVLTDPAKGVKYPLVDDGLAHAAEAYVARGATPYSDALAEKAFTLAWGSLPAAFAAKGASPAKGDMLLASNLAGLAFNAAGLGLCHGLAHALGGRFHVPHGRLNALLLPAVISFNAADERSGKKYGRLAGLCALTPTARSLSFALERLRGRLEQPRRLSGCGVEPAALRSALDAVAADALADFCTASNPRPAGPEDVKVLLRELA